MNRTALSLRMLQILRSRGRIKKSELAELLETNPRNIVELKRELETAGYMIEAENGRYGGYRLDYNGLLPVCALTAGEQQALHEAYAYLDSLEYYLKDQNFNRAFEKVLAGNVISKAPEGFTISGTHASMPDEELMRYYHTVNAAIRAHQRLKLDYRPKNRTVYQWVIHPYHLFQYRDMWYLLGYRQPNDQHGGKTLTLKLNRITALEATAVPFHYPTDLNIDEYVSRFGIVTGKLQEVVLKIKGRYYLSEYLYGEDQHIESLDDDTIVLSVRMRGEISIKQFVLSLGSDCEVIKPTWLKIYIQTEAERVREIYTKTV